MLLLPVPIPGWGLKQRCHYFEAVRGTELTRTTDKALTGQISFMTATEGAQSAIVAATSLTARSGEYYGPDGPQEKRLLEDRMKPQSSSDLGPVRFPDTQ